MKLDELMSDELFYVCAAVALPWLLGLLSLFTPVGHLFNKFYLCR
jgi:hypothetical protein